MQHSATFYTTTEAGRRLGVVPQTVRRMVERGQLRAQFAHNGYQGRMLIDPASVEEHLSSVAGSRHAQEVDATK